MAWFSKERFQYRLYRLQQRLAITRRELTTLGVILCLLALGTIVKEYRKRTLRFDPAMYVESDSLFEAATAALLQLETPAGDSLAEPADSSATTPHTDRININTATKQELERLPRIGPAMAERIIAYRKQKGRFRNTSELMEVRGIGGKTFEQLRDLVVVE